MTQATHIEPVRQGCVRGLEYDETGTLTHRHAVCPYRRVVRRYKVSKPHGAERESTTWFKYLRKALRELDTKCRHCRQAPATDLHHTNPVGEGGQLYDLHNLEFICKHCHSKVHGDMPVIAQRHTQKVARLTKRRVKQAHQMRQQGMSAPDIGKVLGVKHGTAESYLYNYDAKGNPTTLAKPKDPLGNYPACEHKRRAYWLQHQFHLSNSQVDEVLGLSPQRTAYYNKTKPADYDHAWQPDPTERLALERKAADVVLQWGERKQAVIARRANIPYVKPKPKPLSHWFRTKFVRIVQLRRSGMNWTDIAKEMGLRSGANATYYYKRLTQALAQLPDEDRVAWEVKLGKQQPIQMRKPPGRMPEHLSVQAYELRCRGLTYREVGTRLGLTKMQAKDRCRRYAKRVLNGPVAVGPEL